jgi:hypothetical protein
MADATGRRSPAMGSGPGDGPAEGPSVDSALLLLLLSESLACRGGKSPAPTRFAMRLGDALDDLAAGSLLAQLTPALRAYARDAWIVAGGDTQVLEVSITGLRFVLAERVATAEHPAGCVDVFIDEGAHRRFQFRYCGERGAIVALGWAPSPRADRPDRAQ